MRISQYSRHFHEWSGQAHGVQQGNLSKFPYQINQVQVRVPGQNRGISFATLILTDRIGQRTERAIIGSPLFSATPTVVNLSSPSNE